MGTENKQKALSFHYIFRGGDGTTKSFEIFLDPRTLNCIGPAVTSKPEWTRLSFNQCDNCPLDPKEHEYCPIALNITNLVAAFRDHSSYENAYVMVMTKERDISKNTTVESGMSSLLGIYMVTSGCPIMEKLKPLVRYHLPFATLHETSIRIMSMYLLIQFYLKRKGKKPDWDMKGLEQIYDEVRKVNEGMARRLKAAAFTDASLNAIANLNNFASLVPLVITDTLEEIEDSLSAYLEK